MAYEVVMPYHLHMPSYFLETFTEYPYFTLTRSQRYKKRPLNHDLADVLRKLGDSNPRYGYPYVSLANWWFQPLTQTSFLFRGVISQTRCKDKRINRNVQIFCAFF